MGTPKTPPKYNRYFVQKGNDVERHWTPTYVPETTLKALEELEYIRNWKQFVAICEDQKRKRGW